MGSLHLFKLPEAVGRVLMQELAWCCCGWWTQGLEDQVMVLHLIIFYKQEVLLASCVLA
jgi:hypothetical protein